MKALGERTVILDCDVLQADGGTRTAAITGASLALAIALQKLVAAGTLKSSPLDPDGRGNLGRHRRRQRPAGPLL